MAVNRSYGRLARATIATNVGLASIVAAVVAILANILVSELSEDHSLRFDLSGRGWHSLQEETKGFVRSLDAEIDAYIVFGQDAPIRSAARMDPSAQTPDTGLLERVYRPLVLRMMQQVAELVGETAELNKKIRLQVADADSDIERPREWSKKIGISGQDMVNALVLHNRATKTTKVVPFYRLFQVQLGGPRVNQAREEPKIFGEVVEEGIIWALKAVIATGPRKLYLSEGHKELAQYGFTSLLGTDGFETAPLNLAITKTIPSDAAGLIVISPEVEWLPETRQALKDYFLGGGRIFFAQGARCQEQFSGILELADVKLERVLTRHATSYFPSQGKGALFGTYFLTPRTNEAAHPASRTILESGRPIYFGFTRVYETGDRYDKDLFRRTIVARTNDGAETIPYIVERNEILQRPNLGTKSGDFTIAVSIEQKTPAGKNPGKAIFFATDEWLNVGPLGPQLGTANADFARAIMHWMTDRTDFIPSRTKSAQAAIANLDENAMATFKVVLVGIIPGLIFLAGLLVFAIRRRA